MTEKEFKEIFKLLEEQGWNPQLCDTPVPYYDNPVKCGVPTEIGDEDLSDYVLIPKSLLGAYPEIIVPADGDSMRDAGYDAGDRLRVRMGTVPNDGDNVLAWIDGRCTVKTLFTDEDGQRWLVPRNENYDALLLTEEMNVRILGVVIGVEKVSVRASSRTLLQSIRKTKSRIRAAKKLTDEEVNQQIVNISSEIGASRQWFAVYRAMVDYGVQTAGDFQGFCNHIGTLFPDSNRLPNPKDLSRMEVQSFSKPVVMWTADNAPVTGARFQKYRRIALLMGDYLSEKSAAK